MTTIAYLDCSAGVAGDMILGALIDAGAPLDQIKKSLESLHGIQGEWDLKQKKMWKGPGEIAATKIIVESIHNHRPVQPPSRRTSHEDSHSDSHDHHHHDHEHSNDHHHDHHHEHHHDPSHDHQHEHGHAHSQEQIPMAVPVDIVQGSTHHHTHDHSHSHDHGHGHDHTHSHHHDHGGHGHGHSHGEEDGIKLRNLGDIADLVLQSDLSPWVKENSMRVFTLLAEAEAHTHGTTVDEIHFHEVGAIDSIIDTVGSVLALDLLGVREVHCSHLPFSSGTVKCMHGILPVPPPATFRLMIGIPVCQAPKGAKGELVTPTGISLVKALAKTFGEPPSFIPTHTGVGAGSKEFPHHANIVRVAVGKKCDPNVKSYDNPLYANVPASTSPPLPSPSSAVSASKEIKHDQKEEKAVETSAESESKYTEASHSGDHLVVLETNIDDLNPQVIGYVQELLLEQKALDVWTQPIQMKKNRPGILLNVLCSQENEKKMERIIFKETTTLGIRRKCIQRTILDRKFVEIETKYGRIHAKVGYLDDQIVNIHPEYEECKAIAKSLNVSLKQVIEEVYKQM